MATKAQKIVGWVLTVLSALAFLASAIGKLSHAQSVLEGLASVGIAAEKLTTIGVVELVCALLFLIPQTSFLGLVLLTAYAGGAVFTHYRADQGSVVNAIVLSVITWIAWSLRHPDAIRAAFGVRRTLLASNTNLEEPAKASETVAQKLRA